MDKIFELILSVDMLGSSINETKTNYTFRILEYNVKKKTDKNYIIDGESQRIKINEIGEIKSDRINNTSYIRYIVWILNEDEIKDYKIKLIKTIEETIKTFRDELQTLEGAMDGELLMFKSSYNDGDYKKVKITEDML